MFKKITSVILVATIVFSFSGCSYIAYKDYYTKKDYLNIWELEGVRHRGFRRTGILLQA